MTGEQLSAARAEGWPWCKLADAAGARLDAGRAAAAVLADPNATETDRGAAALALEGALADERACRENLADVFLLLLRCALDAGDGSALPGLLERLMGTGAMRRLEARAEWAEETAERTGHELRALKAAVKRLERENWELARAVVELQEQAGANV